MHTMTPYFFGWLRCAICGRIVIPNNKNPLKWTVIVKGDINAGHTAFVTEGMNESVN